MKEKKQNEVRVGSLLFGSTYLLCGIVQMTAGIAFLILPTVLHTGSNAWTGILTIVSGSFLINASNHKTKLTVVLGLHIGVLLVNLGNLLLMELGDWRFFLRPQQLRNLLRNGHINLVVAAYLSTAIPTIVAFVSAFLSVQYYCCVLISTKKQDKDQKPKKLRDTSTLTDSNNFEWVFQEDQWTSHERVFAKSLDYGDAPMQLASETDIFYMKTFSSPFPTMPTPFVPTNWSSRNVITQQSTYNDNLKRDIVNGLGRFESNSHILRPERPELDASITERDNRPNVSTSPEQVTSTSESGFWPTDWSSTNDSMTIDRSKCDERRLTTDEPIRVEISTVTVPNATIAHSSILPRAEWCLPSRPLATVDNDSLIHLSRLELLARQYRFKSQHWTIEKQIAARLNVQKPPFSNTK